MNSGSPIQVLPKLVDSVRVRFVSVRSHIGKLIGNFGLVFLSARTKKHSHWLGIEPIQPSERGVDDNRVMVDCVFMRWWWPTRGRNNLARRERKAVLPVVLQGRPYRLYIIKIPLSFKLDRNKPPTLRFAGLVSLSLGGGRSMNVHIDNRNTGAGRNSVASWIIRSRDGQNKQMGLEHNRPSSCLGIYLYI